MKKIVIGFIAIMLFVVAAVPALAQNSSSKKPVKKSYKTELALKRGNNGLQLAFGKQKSKNLVAFIKEVNVDGKYVLIRNGVKDDEKNLKKVMMDKAVIVYMDENESKVIGLADLKVGQKAQFSVKKTRGENGEYYALLVVQTPAKPAVPPVTPVTQPVVPPATN